MEDMETYFLGKERALQSDPLSSLENPKPNQIVSMASRTEPFLHVLHVSSLFKESSHEYPDIVPRS
jgi:hypothetical protein